MSKLDFVTLKLFVAIADEGRMSAAAERQHIALAAVSKRVSDLEELLGTELFYRRPRGVELTPAGHAFLDHSRRILDDIDKLQAELSEYGEGVRGHVRIHSNTSAIIAFLPQDLSTFSIAHPQIKLDLQERTSSEAINAVREGVAHIGVFAGHVAADGLEILPYRSDQLVLVVPRNHPLSRYERLFFHEVTEYDFIGLQQDTSLQSLLHEQANQAGSKLRMRIQVRSFDAICRMIHHGMGIGVLPRHTLYHDLRDLNLTMIPLSDEWARREIVIGVRKYEMLTVVAMHLVNHLLKSADGVIESSILPP